MSIKSAAGSAIERLFVLGVLFISAPWLYEKLKPIRDKLTPGSPTPTAPIIPDVLGFLGPQIDTGSVQTTVTAEQPIAKIVTDQAPTGVAPLPPNPNELAPVAGPLGGLFLKIIIVGLFLGTLTQSASASPRSVTFKSVLGPATSTSNVSLSSGSASAPARNCVTKASAFSSGGGTFMILSGPTTTYAVDLSSNTPFDKYWGADDPWCASISTTTTLKISGSTGSTRISYQGYTY